MGPQLADVIKQGQVKLEVRHFPLSAKVLPANEAVECAGDQGYWWAMHDQILKNQAKGVTVDLMKQYARDMGLDTNAFNQCMDGTKYEKLATAEGKKGAEEFKVEGTPTFFLNGKKLTLQKWEDILAAVKKELNK